MAATGSRSIHEGEQFYFHYNHRSKCYVAQSTLWLTDLEGKSEAEGANFISEWEVGYPGEIYPKTNLARRLDGEWHIWRQMSSEPAAISGGYGIWYDNPKWGGDGY